MRRIVCLLCLLFLPHAYAQDGAQRAIAEGFLAALQQGKIAAGYAKLFEGSNIPKDRAQGLAIRKQTEATLPQFGRVLGAELVREEKFGATLSKLTYLLRSERHPTVWEFYFYRPGNRWFLAEINFSDKLSTLTKLAARCASVMRAIGN